MKLLPRRLFSKNIRSKADHHLVSMVKCDFSAKYEPLISPSRLSYIASTAYTVVDETMAIETTSKFDWGPLSDILNCSGSSDSFVLATLSREFSTGCVLHEAIGLGAPDDVLMSIATRFPIMLHQMDINGWYPIHIACAFGASPEFIRYCIGAFPSSAASRDIEGRNAIHLLCQGSWRGVCIQPKAVVEQNMLDILLMLYRTSPSTVISEDDRGVGSIEYAIDSNLGLDFIRTLQCLNVKARRCAARRTCVSAPQ